MHFHLIPTALLLITSFFLFKTNYFNCLSSYESAKLFHAIFTFIYIMLIFYASKWRYYGHWKIWWNMLTYFCCRWIFRIISALINLSIIHRRCCKSLYFYIYFYVIEVCFLLQKNESNSKSPWRLEVILLNNAGIIKRITCFSQLELCFEAQAGYIFSFLVYKTLRAIVRLFFSNFYQIIFFWWMIIPSQLYLFIKSLTFVILWRSFFISS